MAYLPDILKSLDYAKLIVTAINGFPARWENLPDEQKQALFNAAIAALTKALAAYGSK